LRVIFLGGYAKVLADQQLRATTALSVPRWTRVMVLIGEAMDAPLFGPVASHLQEPMGLESDTLALSLEGRAFAAHGCIVRVGGPLVRVPSFTAVPGRELLRGAKQLRLDFPAAIQGTVALVVRGSAHDSSAVTEHVEWSARGAALGEHQLVADRERTALLIAVDAAGPWSLTATVDADYEIEGITAIAAASAAVAEGLERTANWIFLDHTFDPNDAMGAPEEKTVATVRMELQQ
jgi:hypothetical protein